jgi:branched-chain amino acid transport system substrate-binding protein
VEREQMKAIRTFMGIALSLALCTSAAAGEIVIGHMADLSGPTSAVGGPYSDGIIAYTEMINDGGGINGKRIRLITSDYAYKIPEALGAYRKFIQKDKVLAIQGWGTADTEALTKKAGKDKVPYLSASYSVHLTNPEKAPYNFFIAADYTTQLRAGLKYLKDSWTGQRAPKLAFIYPSHPFGKAPIKGGEAYAKELGFEIVGHKNVSLRAIDAEEQLLSLKKAEPDFAWIGGTTSSAAVILKDARKNGLKTKFLINIWGNDENLISLAGDAAEGALGIQAAAVYGDNVPGMAALKEATQNKVQPTHFIRGWVSMMVLCEALKIADSNDELTGPGVKKALESLNAYDTGGLTTPLSYSEKDHRPNMSAKIYEFTDGMMNYRETVVLERRADWLGR